MKIFFSLRQVLLGSISLCIALATMPISADEGMWLYNQIPTELLQQRYGFVPDQAWLDHVRLASVRFNSGGSGSFVSSRGLVMTFCMRR